MDAPTLVEGPVELRPWRAEDGGWYAETVREWVRPDPATGPHRQLASSMPWLLRQWPPEGAVSK
jgi:hypothetical protein